MFISEESSVWSRRSIGRLKKTTEWEVKCREAGKGGRENRCEKGKKRESLHLKNQLACTSKESTWKLEGTGSWRERNEGQGRGVLEQEENGRTWN